MGTDDRLEIKPPLSPKPQIKGDIPQKVTESGAQRRPVPKPRLHKPGPRKCTLNPAGDADQASSVNTDSAASSMSDFFVC